MKKNNIETRKIIFELINKLFFDKEYPSIFEIFLHPLKSSSKPLLQENELHELINLLTNKNPYIENPEMNIEYKDFIEFLDTKRSAVGICHLDTRTINIKNSLIKKAIHHPFTFSDIVSVIGHEQRHYSQYQDNQEDLEFIKDIKRELFSGNLKKEDMDEISKFLVENNLNEQELTNQQKRKYQFGAYLSNACEIDARIYEHKFTNSMYQHLINDELCSKKLKIKLEKSLKRYNICAEFDIKDYNEKIEKYCHLRKKLKNTFNKLLENNKEKLSEEKYLNLLNKVMVHISKDMTPEEKVKYMDWAVDNNHTLLIHQISFNTNGADKKAVSEYLLKTIETKKINFENATDLFFIHSIQYNDIEERKTKNTDLAIKMLNDNQIKFLLPVIENLQKENLNINKLAKNFISYAAKYIENANNKSFNLLLTIRNLIYNFIYGNLSYNTTEELKFLDIKCSEKIDILKPKDMKDYVGEVLEKIRLETEQSTTINP